MEDYYRNADEEPPSPPNALKSKAISPLLPAAEIQAVAVTSVDPLQTRLSPPVEIQRPRSALHAGDFTDESVDQRIQLHDATCTSPRYPKYSINGPLSQSPTTPWYTPGFSFDGFPAGSPSTELEKYTDASPRKHLRSRAPSLSSYSSSYILKAPTTPLVQQSNNTDLDFSPIDRPTSPSKSNRRHTLPPHQMHASHSSPKYRLSGPSHEHHQSSYQKENTFAYQRHYPRRSLTSNWSLQALTSPSTSSYTRPRRPSYQEISPSQNASMVGSFEESILRGSMSTAPSKPLDFTAQIGVLGKGNCKPKCPAHVTIPFPAVFYSWGGVVGRNQSLVDDEPSPYVGHIDLQHSLVAAEKRRSKERSPHKLTEKAHESLQIGQTDDTNSRTRSLIIRPCKKRRRTSPSYMAPQGGSYRIPQQGQLQIIIKNPNKTAVKLFLVPYDLTGMDAGTKTFIRQRCYSTEQSNESSNISSPTDVFNRNVSQSVKKKQTLRYLIHINICSPSSGRFYLYQHIRVVFANRVPDNKEELQNEIQIPQPRYSIYKPTWDSLSPSISTAEARLSAEKSYRRRSSGFERMQYCASQPSGGSPNFSFNYSTPTPPVPPIPFKLDLPRYQDTIEPRERNPNTMNLDHPHSISPSDMPPSPTDKITQFPTTLSSSYKSSSSSNNSSEGYGKLSKGDLGYGGVFGRPGTPDAGEGLLARKLRSLGVRREAE